jgi:hypothetical protein
MNVRIAVLLTVACAVVITAMPVLAHHSFAAEFDVNKVVTLTGTVTKVEWANPHARIYFDVKDEKGKVANWDFELGSPNGLMRLGWRRDSLKPGDEITVNGTLAKNAPNVGNARTITLVKTGKKMFAGSSEGDSNTP